jgi:hypothetical protein
LKNFISSCWGAFFRAVRAVTGAQRSSRPLTAQSAALLLARKRGNGVVLERLVFCAVADDRAQAGFITHPGEQS